MENVLDSFRKHFPYHTAVIVAIHPVTSVLLFTIRLAQQFPSSGIVQLGTLNFILIDLKNNTLSTGAKKVDEI